MARIGKAAGLFLLWAGLALSVAACGARNYIVEATSMENTLQPGDRIVVVPAATYNRGDIVVFDPPQAWAAGTQMTPFIKRVIGVSDDVIEIKDGKVWVNGTALDEQYTYEQQPTTAAAEEPATWTVGPGELFVLGDRRAASADSRVFGPIPIASVVGRLAYRLFPSPGPVK